MSGDKIKRNSVANRDVRFMKVNVNLPGETDPKSSVVAVLILGRNSSTSFTGYAKLIEGTVDGVAAL